MKLILKCQMCGELAFVERPNETPKNAACSIFENNVVSHYHACPIVALGFAGQTFGLFALAGRKEK